jgi:ARC6-like, IMS domain/DnaJ domain
VRIPLDYYRILGLPTQATAEQLKQAHRDRTLQLPRREYSDAAISARRQLIDEAYTLLSDPDQRQFYDNRFLANAYEFEPTGSDEFGDELGMIDTFSDPHSPSIEIAENQFIGALLILQELGEYELVLKLGRPYLSSGDSSLQDGRFGEPRLVLSDIVLTVALSCLELGREQWQQGQYENAAEALITGQELLLREGVFAAVRGEIQVDLLKLRPYRILELLALPIGNADERKRGLQLLRTMLQERGGIDGMGNDQSGLSIDDFLRFIQQLRGYLTAEEQQGLFEEEARRPSAVATYLAVYALLAQGFAQQQPILVRRAKSMLLRLGGRQDVHLEQAVCSLLLGQTEEASRALELSQEYEPLVFIREHSQGAPDLLPGLCLYAERWLQDEVFPHFRDLAQRKVLLKDYFADQQVQSYLEALPVGEDAINPWAPDPGLASVSQPVATGTSAGYAWGQGQRDRVVSNGQVAATSVPQVAPRDVVPLSSEPSTPPPGRRVVTAATLATGALAASNVVSMPVERTAPVVPEEGIARVDRGNGKARPRINRHPPDSEVRIAATNNTTPARRVGESAPPPRRRSSRLFFFLGAGLVLVALLGFLLTRLLKGVTPDGTSGEPLLVELDQPVLPWFAPPAPADTNVVTGEMDQATAEKLIQLWFTAKSSAMGEAHEIDKLEKVLADPKLSEWRGHAQEAKRDSWYKQYEHTVKVDSVEVSASDPNQATVTATVTEVSKYSHAGQVAEPETDELKLQYSLIREDNQWRINNWRIL